MFATWHINYKLLLSVEKLRYCQLHPEWKVKKKVYLCEQMSECMNVSKQVSVNKRSFVLWCYECPQI